MTLIGIRHVYFILFITVTFIFLCWVGSRKSVSNLFLRRRKILDIELIPAHIEAKVDCVWELINRLEYMGGQQMNL